MFTPKYMGRARMHTPVVASSIMPKAARILGSMPRLRELARNSTTHEVNDLKPVAFGELGRRPLAFRHDAPVAFDGHAIGLHTELIDQLRECG